MVMHPPSEATEGYWVVSCDGCPRCHLIHDAPAELLADPERLQRRARQILAAQLWWLSSSLLDLCPTCAQRSWN